MRFRYLYSSRLRAQYPGEEHYRFEEIFTFYFLLFASLSGKASWALQARVIGVQDGNTVRVFHEGRLESVDLYGVRAPGKDQPFGEKAAQFLSSLLEDRDVEVTAVQTGRDGRIKGIITVDGENLNRKMIAFGLGWVDDINCSRPECREWTAVQDRVGPSGKGLWSLAIPRSAGREPSVTGTGPAGPQKPKFVKIELKCKKCGRIHKFYLQFGKDPRLIAPARKGGYNPLPDGDAICLQLWGQGGSRWREEGNRGDDSKKTVDGKS